MIYQETIPFGLHFDENTNSFDNLVLSDRTIKDRTRVSDENTRYILDNGIEFELVTKLISNTIVDSPDVIDDSQVVDISYMSEFLEEEAIFNEYETLMTSTSAFSVDLDIRKEIDPRNKELIHIYQTAIVNFKEQN